MSATTTAFVPPVKRGDDLVDRRVGIDSGERALHRDGDVLVQRVGVLEHEIEQRAVLQRPDHVGQRRHVAVADDRQLRDRVALHHADRLRHLLVRGDRDERGRVSRLGSEQLAHRRRGGRALEEAVLDHPVVVEELREIRPPRVRQDRQHLRVGAERLRVAQRRGDRRARRASDQQPLLAGHAPRCEERVAIGDAGSIRRRPSGRSSPATCPCRSPRRGRGAGRPRWPRCRPSPRDRRRRSARRACAP